MLSLLTAVSLAALALSAPAASDAPGWQFDVKPNLSGIVALEAIVVNTSLVVMFDRATGDQPLKLNGKSVWGALWDLDNSTVRPLEVLTDSFCASGALLSNGTMVSIGGTPGADDGNFAAPPGNQAIRIFEPCASASGAGCTLFENPATLHLLEERWYPSSVRIFDGSLMIIGGSHVLTPFYNVDPANSFEFFPRKEQTPRPSAFLNRTLPANLFPRAFALPDGTVFIVANNQSIIYNIETDTETPLPDIPNGVRVTNPIDGSAILLPLSPPNFTPEVLVCGGSTADTSLPSTSLSSQQPASSQCSRITLTSEGIAAGWQVEHMLEGRMMPELVHLPNGQILITNGAGTGFAAISSVGDPVGNSNADHPVLTPSLYTPDAPLGQRISNAGLPTTDIPRLYHSSVTLTQQGNFLIGGNNPNQNFTPPGTPGIKFPSELRIETLDPPFMSRSRPELLTFPEKLSFGQQVTVPVTIPSDLQTSNIQVSLMDLGFSSHAFHSSARLVFMESSVSAGGKSLTFTAPPNGRVFPPGPAVVFLTVDDVTSVGQRIMMGSGNSPPTLE
ncbi:uncharacterized protein PHACADRAFT_258261 [Phanerochaete carnosa HHB-10118-sp]|uniref:Glyoxal oxidase n=1 Tax=Phanerochaete carnosa (strain HHB-10118-sp) TaxID=650164 RepID=K5VSG3_PHACS|nr:uncharacterized protein PHACADRAFT_258261 [Phanerochaete carnosa HHB-10118-sp]EKM54423.1 hypothetical protein PHACADRAFT_258261 [Phanerochaete carnosa HHB-10118-sp]